MSEKHLNYIKPLSGWGLITLGVWLLVSGVETNWHGWLIFFGIVAVLNS